MSIGRIAGKAAAEQLIGIEEMLRKQAEKQLEQAQNGKVEQDGQQKSILEAVRAAKTNIMGGNFSGHRIDADSSRYIEASLQIFQELRQQKNATLAQAWANADSLGGIQGKSRQLIEREKLREKLNEANIHIKEEIEDKAQEAMAPKDAEGQPITEVSIGSEPEVPKIAEAPPTTPEIVEAAPEVAISAPTVSIDIKV